MLDLARCHQLFLYSPFCILCVRPDLHVWWDGGERERRPRRNFERDLEGKMLGKTGKFDYRELWSFFFFLPEEKFMTRRFKFIGDVIALGVA